MAVSQRSWMHAAPPRSGKARFPAILFRGIVVETIGCMILQLLGLNMLAVHSALVGVLGFVPIGKDHVVADLVLWKIGKSSGSGPLAMSRRAKILFSSVRHIDFSIDIETSPSRWSHCYYSAGLFMIRSS
jgi:hypothetical protein